MSDAKKSQMCGNCGGKNEAAAIICATCGVVMAAYPTPMTPPESEPTPPPVTAVEVSPAVSEPEFEAGDAANQPSAGQSTATPGSGSDWRDIFARSPIERPEPDPIVEPPRIAQPRQRPARPEPPPPEPVEDESKLPASVAAMRRRARNQPQTARPIPPPRTAPDASETPRPSPVQFERSNVPRLAFAGLVVMFLSCVLFGITAAISTSDAPPAFALFCLFPIGVIMLVSGVIGVARKNAKHDQRKR